MSQTENAVTSSSGTKRAYRKGNPLTLAERQQASLARKRATHKELRVFIPAALKAQLQEMCEAEGAKWHLNRSQFGIRIDHDLASISDHSLASQSITIWHASDH
ncbi:replication regulatory protein RepA [Escherichia coli]|nr:replication regulatory protein RepA [Escherichia coli]MCY6736525.1 replication regulatory protein RepA [Escherichia coli]